MKILVVLTGGTIGSTLENNIIDVKKNNSYTLLEMYRSHYNNDIEFDVITPINILSENITMQSWQTIINSIMTENLEKYSGIIIAHGSDTLSYTSALLSIVFCNINIPLVLIASNYVLTDSRSNGLINFASAVEFIKNSGLCGVFVSYSDSHLYGEIYIGSRVVKADCFSDRFSSFDTEKFAVVSNNEINILNKDLSIPNLYSSGVQADNLNGLNPCFNNKVVLNNEVAIISAYPSIDYSQYNFSDNVKAVLHLGYHCATACAQGKTGILNLINKCNNQNIDFYIASLKPTADIYETTKQMLEAGAKPLYNINEESAYAKLILAYNQNKIDVDEFVNTNWFFENIL